MRCRGFNHQIAAKKSFCGPGPGLCRRPASGGARCLRCARMVSAPKTFGKLRTEFVDPESNGFVANGNIALG
jgi:hypothetical protein